MPTPQAAFGARGGLLSTLGQVPHRGLRAGIVEGCAAVSPHREGICGSPVMPSAAVESACGGPQVPGTQPIVPGLPGARLFARSAPSLPATKSVGLGALYLWHRFHGPPPVSVLSCPWGRPGEGCCWLCQSEV